MKFTKMIRIDTEPDHASERMVDLLTSKLPHGKATQLMRDWMTAGFLISECKKGILEYLLASDKSSMDPMDRLNHVMKYFEIVEQCAAESKQNATPISNPVTRPEPPPARKQPPRSMATKD